MTTLQENFDSGTVASGQKYRLKPDTFPVEAEWCGVKYSAIGGFAVAVNRPFTVEKIGRFTCTIRGEYMDDEGCHSLFGLTLIPGMHSRGLQPPYMEDFVRA